MKIPNQEYTDEFNENNQRQFEILMYSHICC